MATAYADVVHLEMRYDRWFLPFSAPFGLGPEQSDLRIDDGVLHVKMGWGFQAEIPLTSITDARLNTDKVLSRGVHGLRGRWLVNGSSDGIVELNIDPPVRAQVSGLPVTLRNLRISVTDPDALIAAVGSSS